MTHACLPCPSRRTARSFRVGCRRTLRRPHSFFLVTAPAKKKVRVRGALRRATQNCTMAAIKRKAEHGSTPSKREKPTSSDRSAKRRKSHDATEPSPAKAKPEDTATKNVLQEEERSFPRGGASVLTPLEHKQIQIKANQDVLFEQAGIKRTGEDGLSDMDMDDSEPKAPKPSKRRPLKKSHRLQHGEEKEQSVRVEGLSYKVIVLEHCSPPTIDNTRNYRLERSFSAKLPILRIKISFLPSQIISLDM